MTEGNATYTTQELVDLLGITQQAVSSRSKREHWQGQKRFGRGGGYEWLVVSMPKATRMQLAHALTGGGLPPVPAPLANQFAETQLAVNAAPCSPCSALTQITPPLFPVLAADSSTPLVPAGPKASTSPSSLALARANERTVALARLAFVHHIERLVPAIGKEKAIRQLVEASRAGSLSPHLAPLVKAANATPREGATLTRRSLYRWLGDFAAGGEAALAPHFRKPDMTVPEWGKTFLALYQVPQHKPITQVYHEFHDVMLASGNSVPSIHKVRRFLNKIATPDLEAGRATGNALLKLHPHKHRSTRHMFPTDCYTGDGTTFDAEVMHPFGGAPIKPEVWATLDVATRRCVGVSAGFAESGLVVLDSLVMACFAGGIPALYYADKGPGNTAGVLTNEWTGVFCRLGIEPADSIPGRPQGHGLMERAVKTLWVECAKELATYTGSDMDTDAAKKIYKITRKELKAAGKKQTLPGWQDFLQIIQTRIIRYNSSPHRGLPKFMDVHGKYRHYSPDEYWQSFIDKGFQPVAVPPMCRDELFLPAERRMVRNGWVQFYQNDYFAQDLAQFHGEQVEVRYSPYDASAVYIYTSRGERICEATLNGNDIPYFPISRIENAIEVRNKKAVERLEAQAQKFIPGARIELPDATPRTLVVDSTRSATRSVSKTQTLTPATDSTTHKAVLVDVTQPKNAGKPSKPMMFSSRHERYCWLMKHTEQQNVSDKQFLNEYAGSAEYVDLAEWYIAEGIAFYGSVFQQTA